MHLNCVCNRAGSLLSLFFTKGPVENYHDAATSDLEAFKQYFSSMLADGIYIAPSQFEALFVSGVHSDEDIEKTVEAVKRALIK